MSFALPISTTVVDKHLSYPNQTGFGLYTYSRFNDDTQQSHTLPTIWQIISKYESFRELIRIARMEDILDDPQANMTIFVPMDLVFPRITMESCINNKIERRDVIAINFELARTMVNSVIIPSMLTTTMMMQSAFTRYKTRDSLNTLTTETSYCAQLSTNRPLRSPFNLVVNGKSKILIHDILASNGIVHTIDKFPYY
jgi:uncharacterized surface protein with fasciclin (FAS1) repeats